MNAWSFRKTNISCAVDIAENKTIALNLNIHNKSLHRNTLYIANPI